MMTPQDDDLIRQCFQAKQGEVDNVLRQCLPHHTTDALFRRAAELGLVKYRQHTRWTQAEIDMLESVAHRCVRHIQKRLDRVSPPGVRRTRCAILGYITKNRVRTNLDGLNHTELADALGVTRDTLHRYREDGLIYGRRKESQNPIARHNTSAAKAKTFHDHQQWYYTNANIRRFIAQNPAILDLGRVAKEWFIDLLLGKALLKTVAKKQEQKSEPRHVYPVHGIYSRL